MLVSVIRTLCVALALVGLAGSRSVAAAARQAALARFEVSPVFRPDDSLRPAAPGLPSDRPCTIRRVHRVTAYCDRGLTASGVRSGIGQCAAPADVPFGSLVYIPALDRTFLVTDRTAARFRSDTVDLFISGRAACRKFGRHYLECVITFPARPARYASVALQQAAARLARGGQPAPDNPAPRPACEDSACGL